MEFLVGFLFGGACVIFLLVRWARARSIQEPPSTTSAESYSYEPIVEDFQAESKTLLREVRGAFSAYSRKRK